MAMEVFTKKFLDVASKAYRNALGKELNKMGTFYPRNIFKIKLDFVAIFVVLATIMYRYIVVDNSRC
jgi:hypothetical protein